LGWLDAAERELLGEHVASRAGYDKEGSASKLPTTTVLFTEDEVE